MAEPKISFDDGAAYELLMGKWSQLVGDVFLDWLSLPSGLRWIDVGCGNGAFTQLVVDRFAPAEVQGVDPSSGQLVFARKRSAARLAKFQQGDAMALPFDDHRFDAAVMALVIFFVPEPAKGVAEMVRIVRPGGWVSAYAWDIPGRGFPLAAIQDEMLPFGIVPMRPPHPEVSRMDALLELWESAGLEHLNSREIVVQREFASFEEFWTIGLTGASIGEQIASLTKIDAKLLKERVRLRLPADAQGRITYSARAHAIVGRVPK
ncbi:class I SAM-dependent methyltransferase [Bosea sp. (in: a-proteobacteria)]|uniref:class I SAM-dependent methyltransferase n=1 Tax=Bosea sp. (in: a-proteobacteria) TaxID=1871050 RepID=UPI002732ADA9|nr:class I SAM-dependent methyltransferase [Bosea sp. (in: a-proteobacteria)]MDP3257482.1 class I SAM-dependent methyltransferase [Bosea sp. (in: a-proteobacteria)]